MFPTPCQDEEPKDGSMLGFCQLGGSEYSQHSSKQSVGQTELAVPGQVHVIQLLSPFQHSSENPLVPLTWLVSTRLVFVINYYFYVCGCLTCI